MLLLRATVLFGLLSLGLAILAALGPPAGPVLRSLLAACLVLFVTFGTLALGNATRLRTGRK